MLLLFVTVIAVFLPLTAKYIGDNFKNLYASLKYSLAESLFPIGPRVKLLIPIGPSQLSESRKYHSRSYSNMYFSVVNTYENRRAMKNVFCGSPIWFGWSQKSIGM
jgi:hypothetical protein